MPKNNVHGKPMKIKENSERIQKKKKEENYATGIRSRMWMRQSTCPFLVYGPSKNIGHRVLQWPSAIYVLYIFFFYHSCDVKAVKWTERKSEREIIRYIMVKEKKFVERKKTRSVKWWAFVLDIYMCIVYLLCYPIQ